MPATGVESLVGTRGRRRPNRLYRDERPAPRRNRGWAAQTHSLVSRPTGARRDVLLKSLLKAKTKFTGPLSHGKVRTKKDIIAAANTGLTDLALVGEGYVKKQLYRGHGVQTGHLRASISGGLQKNLVAVVDAGQQLQGRDVIYAGWVETGIRRGVQTAFAGYGMFKAARAKLNRLDFDKFIGKDIIAKLG